MGPQQQAPSWAGPEAPRLGSDRLPSLLPSPLLLGTARSSDLTGHQQNPLSPRGSFPDVCRLAEAFPGVGFPGGQGSAGDRAAIRRVLGHLVRFSITSTGQALTRPRARPEGRREDQLSAGLSAEGWAPGPKSGRADRSQEAHPASFLFFLVLHLCLSLSASLTWVCVSLSLSLSPFRPASALSPPHPHHLQVHLRPRGTWGLPCGSCCIAQPS